ncbi:MAG: alpha/beta fold hydrolase [Bernardetiaceae bacterium]|nr:alpha/beta fold hydrolase [Bernardetiaceae bacterium]
MQTLELNYKKLGAGSPLLVLHGLFGSLDNWMTLAKRWAEDFEVYLIDQRNHGRSPHGSPHSYEAMSADLLTFIEQHDIKDPVILGHSMGGKTAMQFALEHSEKLSRLIVIDMGVRAYPTEETHGSIIRALLDLNIDDIKSRGQADKALATSIPEFGVRQFLLKNLNREGSDNGFSWRMNLPLLCEQIEDIGVAISDSRSFDKPTLFLAGAKSKYIQEKDHADIRSIFSDVRIETVSEAGHWIHAEQPDIVYEQVRDFMS